MTTTSPPRDYNATIAELDQRRPGFARMMSLLLDVLEAKGEPDAALDDLISRAMSDLTADQVSAELERMLIEHVEGAER